MASFRNLVRAIRPSLFMVESKRPGAEIASGIRGTAFVVDADRGLLLTAAHVVGDDLPHQLRVQSVYNSHSEYCFGLVVTVKAVYVDSEHDLAVLGISPYGTRGRGLQFQQAQAEVGDELVLFGFGGGTDHTYCDKILGSGSSKSPTPLVFAGNLSARVPDDDSLVELLVYDLSTFAGNSGAPVLSGETGQTVAIHIRGTDNQLGYGIPAEQCRAFVDSVREGLVPSRIPAAVDITTRLRDFSSLAIKLEGALTREHGAIDKGAVQAALMKILELDDSRQLLEWDWADMDLDEILCPLEPLIVKAPEILCEINVGDSIIPTVMAGMLLEVKLKAGGEIWYIHKYDADFKPSNPHGHNAETNLKLNLSSGELYLHGKKVGAITKKNLMRVRELAAERKVKLPALAAE